MVCSSTFVFTTSVAVLLLLWLSSSNLRTAIGSSSPSPYSCLHCETNLAFHSTLKKHAMELEKKTFCVDFSVWCITNMIITHKYNLKFNPAQKAIWCSMLKAPGTYNKT